MSKRLTLEEILEFVRLMDDFDGVERRTRIAKLKRNENDAEHSYSLAMLAWYIVEANGLNLDLDKVIRYALVHDLVEVYAGDTFVYGDDGEISSKKDREEKALKKLEKNFPKFKDLAQTIKDFESKEDEESKFVYALDKLHPTIHNYFDKGKLWKKYGISLETIIQEKEKKVSAHAQVKEYFAELMEVLRKNKSLFPDEEKH